MSMNFGFTREDLVSMTSEDLQAKLAEAVATKQAEFSTMTEEDLKKAEEELMDLFKENDKHIESTKYSFPSETVYDGEVEKSRKIIRDIISFLNRIKINWQSSLGMYQAIKYWMNVKESAPEVSYYVFDSTIRMLGTLEYQGLNDCRSILFINNWFSTVHPKYVADQAYTQLLHALHESVLQQMEKPDETEEEK